MTLKNWVTMNQKVTVIAQITISKAHVPLAKVSQYFKKPGRFVDTVYKARKTQNFAMDIWHSTSEQFTLTHPESQTGSRLPGTVVRMSVLSLPLRPYTSSAHHRIAGRLPGDNHGWVVFAVRTWPKTRIGHRASTFQRMRLHLHNNQLKFRRSIN